MAFSEHSVPEPVFHAHLVYLASGEARHVKTTKKAPKSNATARATVIGVVILAVCCIPLPPSTPDTISGGTAAVLRVSTEKPQHKESRASSTLVTRDSSSINSTY